MTLMETNTAMNRNDAAGDPLAVARSVLLEPHGLDVKDLNGAIGRIFEHKVDYADLYFQYTRSEGWSLDEGIVKSGSFAIEQGVGVRAVSGDRSAFAYSDEINAQALMSAADATRTIARSGRSGRTRVGDAQAAPARRRGRRKAPRLLYGMDDPIASMEAAGKVGLLQRIEAYARRKDPRVTQVMAGLAAEPVRQALVNLEARPAPGGVLSVVLGPGWPGVLLHEAVGHGLEGDFNRKKSSVFSGRIGERVAAKGVTVLDDGTLPDRRGSLNIDDEGNPTQRNVLIEDGVLKGYLQDSLNARLMKVPVTGNGRRESFAHLPMPRMTNTFMLGGKHEPDEILASLERGLYAVNFGGGQVDITNGKFVFSASEAYWVENGKIQYPVKGATIIGNGPDALTRVTMIGNDMSLDPGIGVCGKDGQSVPVGVGQPTLRIEGLTVGGTA